MRLNLSLGCFFAFITNKCFITLRSSLSVAANFGKIRRKHLFGNYFLCFNKEKNILNRIIIVSYSNVFLKLFLKNFFWFENIITLVKLWDSFARTVLPDVWGIERSPHLFIFLLSFLSLQGFSLLFFYLNCVVILSCWAVERI